MNVHLRPRWTFCLGILAAALLVAATDVTAQTGSVAGRVFDAATGQPLPTAQVFISDLDVGSLTQQNGSYILLNVPAGQRSVSVQRIGYREMTQEVLVTAGQTAVLDFRVSEEALQLDEIVITGTAGGQRRRALGNTVAQVDAGAITQEVAITSFQDLITARTPGLRFTGRAGSVGSSSQIQIRGAGSFNSARQEPLIFVDGIRVNGSSSVGPSTGLGRVSHALDDFNPEDVESIEIIKGPAAASLYGTEASAGVIQIITKRGAQGSPEFNISVRQGVNYMPNPAGQVGQQWTCPTDPAPGPVDCQQQSDLVPYNMYDESTRYIREGYFDWPTPNLFQNGHAQGYTLDIRGGTETIRYFVSGNYDKEEGAEYWNVDEAYRLRSNVNVVFSEMFSFDLSLGYATGHTRYAMPVAGDGGIWQDLKWSNGHFLDRVTPFDQPGADVRRGGYQEHLPTDVAEQDVTRDYSRFTGSATLNFTSGNFDVGPLTGALTQRLVAGVDRGWDVNRRVFLVEDGAVPEHLQQYTSEWDPVYSETVTGEMHYERPIVTGLSVDYGASLRLFPNDVWSFTTSAGVQYYVDERDEFSNSGTGFASPISTTINQLAQAQISTDYSLIENKSLGYYVQQEIGWNDRLFVTGAMRFDDNSTFGSTAPAQRFPKLSATWVLSEESFWSIAPINSFRVRGAWGQAGRQPSSTSGQNIYVAIPGPAGTSAIRPSSPGNPGIEPEVSTELELGFDISMFDGRVSGEFTHFSRKDEQALLGVPLDPSFGFPGSVDQNVGRIDNWGWEAALTARVYENDAFSFDLDLGVDNQDNEIKDLGSFPGGGGGQAAAIRIGYPYPNYQSDNHITRAEFTPGGRFNSAFNQQADGWCDEGIPLGPTSQYGRLPGGAERPCQDILTQQVLAGPSFVKNTFTVAPRIGLLDGQLSIFALAEGQYGRIHQDRTTHYGHTYNNSLASRLENDPVFVVNENINGNSPAWGKSLFKADFWKLREVGARYTLPPSLVEPIGGTRGSLSISARNTWTIWQASKELFGHTISDPEGGSTGNLSGGGVYHTPPLASLNATLRITF